MPGHTSASGPGTSARKATSLDKALDLCELLSGMPRGATLSEVARQLKQPAATAHRLLAVLKRRGFVRQEEDTGRYQLTLRWLDLSFRAIGRSEIRLHAYPVLREHVLRTQTRAFVAVPGDGEVTYVWSSGADEVSMYTAYGRAMPGHCSIYFGADQEAARHLVCAKLESAADRGESRARACRLGRDEAKTRGQSLNCTCAPVRDYSGREVARVGVFGHGEDEDPLHHVHVPAAWELARAISLRLGHLGS